LREKGGKKKDRRMNRCKSPLKFKKGSRIGGAALVRPTPGGKKKRKKTLCQKSAV